MEHLEQFRQEVRDWLEENCPPTMRTPLVPEEEVWGGRNAEYVNPESKLWLERMGEKGWTAPNLPKEYGGGGLDRDQTKVLHQELFRIKARPALNSFGIWMLAPCIIEFGSEEQKREHLPKIIKGEIRWCQGYSEPGAGSDLANLKTKAVLSDDGTYYTVNGSKIWTTLAHVADWIFCLTRTDDSGIKQQGITFLLFPMKQEGIEVKPIITLGGSHTVNTVHFTDVKVPVENRIGEEGKGWTYAKGLLEHERTGLAGLSKSLVELEQLKDNARSIQRGNGNLMDNSSYRSKVGELEIDLLATEFTELRSLASAAAGGEPGPESSILKLKGTEIKQRIQKLTVEASGIYSSAWGDKGVGPSFAKGGTAGYLNSRYFTIYGGASEVQKDIVAKKVLGLTKGSSK